MLTPHEQLLYSKGYNFQERFIKDLWHSLWTTKIQGEPLVVHLEYDGNH